MSEKAAQRAAFFLPVFFTGMLVFIVTNNSQVNDLRLYVDHIRLGVHSKAGLLTYRGINDLHKQTLTIENISIEQVCRSTQRDVGHRVIAELQNDFDITVLTQNIDRFHYAAGSQREIEIHCVSAPFPKVVLFGEMPPIKAVDAWHEQGQQGFDAVFSVSEASIFNHIAEFVFQVAKQNKITVEINSTNTPVTLSVNYKFAAKAIDIFPQLLTLLRA